MSLSDKFAIQDALMAVLDEETALAVIDYRKGLGRKHVLTERSAKMMAKQLAKFADPQAAAEEMILRGWQTIKPDWIQRSQPQRRMNAVEAYISRQEQTDEHASRAGDYGHAELFPSNQSGLPRLPSHSGGPFGWGDRPSRH